MGELSREEWLAKRKDFIGASDVAAILGVDPRRGQLSVYEAKVHGHTSEDNDWMAFGRDVEGAIAKLYTKKTGRQTVDLGATKISVHPDIPWLSATLDRETITPKWTGPLELKHVGIIGADPKKWETDPPLHYTLQNMVQMAVTGAEHGSLAAMFPGYQLAWIDLSFDSAMFEQKIYKELEMFWDRVQRRDPPPGDNLPGTLDVAKRMYPDDNGETIQLSYEAQERSDRVVENKAKVRSLTSAIKEDETNLRLELKDSTFGRFPDGSFMSAKVTNKKEYTSVHKATTYRILRRIFPKK